jgi:hypothetical protein
MEPTNIFFFKVVQEKEFLLSLPILYFRKLLLSPAGAKPTQMLESFSTHTDDTLQTLISAILFVDGLLVNLKSRWFCLVCFHSSTAKKYVG